MGLITEKSVISCKKNDPIIKSGRSLLQMAHLYD